MSACPRCNAKKKSTIKVADFFPEFNFLNCYNCKKRFIWVNLYRKKYFIQKKSLLKD
jgi:transcription elongation factor Elf1